jgi:hypothetical protein
MPPKQCTPNIGANIAQLTRWEQRYTFWETLAGSHFNAKKYQTWITDQVNTRNPSTFAQIMDTELETKDKLQQEHPSTTSNKSHQLQKRVVSHHRQQRRLEPPRNQNTSLKKTPIVLPVTTSLKNPKIILPVTKNLKNPTIPHSKKNSLHDILNPDYRSDPDFRSV